MPQGAAETDNFPHARHINAKNLGWRGFGTTSEGQEGARLKAMGCRKLPFAANSSPKSPFLQPKPAQGCSFGVQLVACPPNISTKLHRCL